MHTPAPPAVACCHPACVRPAGQEQQVLAPAGTFAPGLSA